MSAVPCSNNLLRANWKSIFDGFLRFRQTL
jgi:hypothetical protein